MEFQYDPAPQRSPEWFKRRIGKVTASRLEDWLAVSKAKGKNFGQPLKARLDYEKELMFEREFGKSFQFFVNDAMQDGIDFEDFAARQYQKVTGNQVEECGCWFNDYFVASPDRIVAEVRVKTAEAVDYDKTVPLPRLIPVTETALGLLEIKVLRDNSFTEVLTDGVPAKHWKQIQGQLWASQKAWCDYVAINLSTRKMKIIRVLPDYDFFVTLAASVAEPLSVPAFPADGVYDVDEPPQGLLMPTIDRDMSDSNFNKISRSWAE